MTPDELQANLARNEAVQAVNDLAKAFWELEEELIQYEQVTKDLKLRCEKLECENRVLAGENKELRRQGEPGFAALKAKQSLAAITPKLVKCRGVKRFRTEGNPYGNDDQVMDEAHKDVEYTIYGPEEVMIQF